MIEGKSRNLGDSTYPDVDRTDLVKYFCSRKRDDKQVATIVQSCPAIERTVSSNKRTSSVTGWASANLSARTEESVRVLSMSAGVKRIVPLERGRSNAAALPIIPAPRTRYFIARSFCNSTSGSDRPSLAYDSRFHAPEKEIEFIQRDPTPFRKVHELSLDSEIVFP